MHVTPSVRLFLVRQRLETITTTLRDITKGREIALFMIEFHPDFSPLRPKLPSIFRTLRFHEDPYHYWIGIDDIHHYMSMAVPPEENELWMRRFTAYPHVAEVSSQIRANPLF